MSSALKKYFTNVEVSKHNIKTDCWVTLFGKVFDLTPLLRDADPQLAAPIVKFAGEDVTFFFDSSTHEPKTHIDPITGKISAYMPYGRFVHVPAPEDFDKPRDYTPWWSDEKYVIGFLSQHVRKIRLVNTLTLQDDVLEVCSEETLQQIQQRYLAYNKHSTSYTWKRLGAELDMNQTLEQNGIKDDMPDVKRVILSDHAALSDAAERPDELLFVPAIHLYFNDDLTVA